MQGQKYLGAPVIIGLITALSMVGPLSTDMYLPALSDIVSFFGTTEALMNITLYGFFFMQAIGILILGPVSDKFGRKYLLLGSVAVYTIASFLASLALNIGWFITFRCIQGLAAGGFIVISTALIKDCFRDVKVRGRVLTLTVFFGVIGPVIAPILGAWLIEAINWQFTLVFPGIFAFICFVITVFLSEPLSPEEKITEKIGAVLLRMPRLCKNKPFALFLLAMSLLSAPFMCYIAVSSYIYVDGFGLSGTVFSYILAGNALAATFLMLILQRGAGVFGQRRLGLIAIGLTLLTAVLLLTVGPVHPAVCILSILPVCVGAFTARPYAIGILMQQYAGDTGSVSSLFNFGAMMFSCIGMFCGTLPWPTHIFALGATAAIFGVLALLVWIVLKTGGMKLKGLD
ncbi:MAG TPA: MFS transporter [Methanocorpusculum sp.]|nr:MFS transporter [Methanocorpusculum sp.]